MEVAVKPERVTLYARVDKETSEFVSYLAQSYNRSVSNFLNEVFADAYPEQFTQFCKTKITDTTKLTSSKSPKKKSILRKRK